MTAPDNEPVGEYVQSFRCPAVRSTESKDQSAQMAVVWLCGPIPGDQPSHRMGDKEQLVCPVLRFRPQMLQPWLNRILQLLCRRRDTEPKVIAGCDHVGVKIRLWSGSVVQTRTRQSQPTRGQRRKHD